MHLRIIVWAYSLEPLAGPAAAVIDVEDPRFNVCRVAPPWGGSKRTPQSSAADYDAAATTDGCLRPPKQRDAHSPCRPDYQRVRRWLAGLHPSSGCGAAEQLWARRPVFRGSPVETRSRPRGPETGMGPETATLGVHVQPADGGGALSRGPIEGLVQRADGRRLGPGGA